MIILDIAFKDLKRSFRSLFALGMMLGAPLLITGLIYFAFGGLSAGTGRFNLPPLTVVVVNRDAPAAGQPALGALLLDYFADPAMPAWLHTTTAATEAEARAAVDAQTAGVALLIPPTFSPALLSGGPAAPVTLLHDPTLTLGPQIVQDLVRLFTDSVLGAQIALTTTAEQAQAHGVSVDPAALQALGAQYAEWAANAERAQHHSDTPVVVVRAPAQAAATPVSQLAQIMGNIMAGMLVFFVFFTGANSAQSILREDEEGTLARLFTTPAPRSAILAGKFVAVGLTLAGQVVVLVSLSALLFQINWGQPATLALVLAGLLVAAAGFGVCLVAFIKGLRQSGPVIGGVLAVTGMLGGLFTTGVTMPAAFERLNLLMPQGWALHGLQLALSGAPLSAALLTALVLAVYGAALFTIGALAFRRRFA